MRPLREALNVRDLERRDQLVKRLRKTRAEAELDKATYEHWNRLNPDETPIDTAFEDAVIAWCDGKGPLPAIPPEHGR